MMKRIICILLAFVFAISLVSCDVTGAPEEKGFNVHFEVNGGQVIEDMKTFHIESSPFTAQKGHVFEGWFMDESFTAPAQFPMDIDSDITLYAKWLRISHTESIPDASIKLAIGHEATMAKNVTPRGLDLELLQSKGYDTVVVEVKYTVEYEKDYKLPFGYLGAPKYGEFLICSDFDAEFDKDFGLESDMSIDATTTPSVRTLSCKIKISEIGVKKIMFAVSTLNIQNIIHLTNISVTYTAEKSIGTH